MLCPTKTSDSITEEEYKNIINPMIACGSLFTNVEEVLPRLSQVKTSTDWLNMWSEIALIAEQEKRYIQAAFYYHLASLIISDNCELENRYYENVLKCFYDGFTVMNIKYKLHEIPFRHSFINCLELPCENSQYTVVVCCDFDTYLEEYAVFGQYLCTIGYTLYLLEGPGQGNSYERDLMATMPYDEVFQAFLDYTHIKHCSIIGNYIGAIYATIAAASFPDVVDALLLYNPMYKLSNIIKRYVNHKEHLPYHILYKLHFAPTYNCVVNRYLSTRPFLNAFVQRYHRLFQTKNPYDLACNVRKVHFADYAKVVTQPVHVLKHALKDCDVHEDCTHVCEYYKKSSCVEVHLINYEFDAIPAKDPMYVMKQPYIKMDTILKNSILPNLDSKNNNTL